MMDLYHVEMDSQLTLTSLHWADILFIHVLPYLEVEDLFNLRETSNECMEMIDNYFGEMINLRLDQFNFSESHFKILSLTCHNLKKLIIHNCDDVPEDDLKYLLDHNRKIRHIDLSSCCKLTSLCLHPVVIHFKDLNALILNNSIWFTTGCLEAFNLHHSKLEVLELSQCSSLGNVSAINRFLVKCKDLHTLNLSGIDCICDSTMETLSHFNCKLQILDVKFCPRITSYGIRMLIQYCNKLRKLSVVGCSSDAQRFAYDGRVNDVPLLEVEVDAEYIFPAVRVPLLMLQI